MGPRRGVQGSSVSSSIRHLSRGPHHLPLRGRRELVLVGHELALLHALLTSPVELGPASGRSSGCASPPSLSAQRLPREPRAEFSPLGIWDSTHPRADEPGKRRALLRELASTGLRPPLVHDRASAATASIAAISSARLRIVPLGVPRPSRQGRRGSARTRLGVLLSTTTPIPGGTRAIDGHPYALVVIVWHPDVRDHERRAAPARPASNADSTSAQNATTSTRRSFQHCSRPHAPGGRLGTTPLYASLDDIRPGGPGGRHPCRRARGLARFGEEQQRRLHSLARLLWPQSELTKMACVWLLDRSRAE